MFLICLSIKGSLGDPVRHGGNHLHGEYLGVKSPLELGCQSHLSVKSLDLSRNHAPLLQLSHQPCTFAFCEYSVYILSLFTTPEFPSAEKSNIYHFLQNLRLTSYWTLNLSNNCSRLIEPNRERQGYPTQHLDVIDRTYLLEKEMGAT